ncbi:unnamed protein product [Heligmosomoides polygyrus]|uniref:DUF1800 family protein n=1 Tax=Heligmosomoides polygyrus TaxID=6339 RepID=A0A183FJ87_HELPZ|nr:unnamed protein product [Heligmosomoides polygyrus]
MRPEHAHRLTRSVGLATAQNRWEGLPAQGTNTEQLCSGLVICEQLNGRSAALNLRPLISGFWHAAAADSDKIDSRGRAGIDAGLEKGAEQRATGAWRSLLSLLLRTDTIDQGLALARGRAPVVAEAT